MSSLRARLVGRMAMLFVGGAVLLYVAARAYGHTAADRSYDKLLGGSALSIADTLSFTGGAVHVDIPYAALDMLSAAPEDRVFYRVFGPRGGNVTGYSDLPTIHIPIARFVSEPNRVRFFDAFYRGEEVRFALLGREIGEPGISGRVWVQVGQTKRARADLANELVRNALLAMALLTALALALVWFGVTQALRPLRKLSNELVRRDPSDLAPLVTSVPVEISLLVSSLNGFMHRLANNMETQRLFIADAAHQMRTPLAALSAHAQLALDDKDADPMASLRTVERISGRLSRLLNQLLSDATVHHRSGVRGFAPLDLIKVIRRAIRDIVPISDPSEVHFETTLDEAPCTGDALMLGEALKNLIDNALRHGGNSRGSVDITLEAGEHYLIRVADRGPGIPAESRGRLFKRFERGDGMAPGAGLGLAIVQQAVRSHGGEVRLLDRPGGGLVVELVIPQVRS